MARESYQNEIPPSRVNIKYTKHIGEATEEHELPLKFLVVGDFSGDHSGDAPEKRKAMPIEERKRVNVNKNNFAEVMRAKKLKLDFKVKNALDTNGKELDVKMDISSLDDMLPENIAKNTKQLRELLEVRSLLVDLKSRMVNNKEFRKKLDKLIGKSGDMHKLKTYLDTIAPIEKPHEQSTSDANKSE